MISRYRAWCLTCDDKLAAIIAVAKDTRPIQLGESGRAGF
jgi:hypothetical protein